MGTTDTEALLADLAKEYERSSFVLSQLEHCLTARDELTPAHAGRPPMRPAPAVGAIENLIEVDELGEDEDEDEEAEEEVLASASSQPLGFLASPAHVHQPEEVLPSSCVGGDHISAPLRPRVSFIDMSSVAPPMRRPPRRSASLYSLASTPLLPAASPLQSRRAPGDMSRPQLQQQPSPIDAPSPRTSQSNISFGPSVSIMLRLNSEILARGPRQLSSTGGCGGGGGGAESPKSPSLPDIFAQPLRSANSQTHQALPQPGGVSRLAQAMRNSLMVVGDPYDFPSEPLPSPLQLSLPLPLSSLSQQPQLVPVYSGDGISRRGSVSRRGSDYVFSPLGAASLHSAPQPQPQPLDSPRSTCASPGPGSSAGLPTPAASPAGGGGGPRAMRRSSSNNPTHGLRPSLSSSRSQALSWVVMDDLQAAAAAGAAGAAVTDASPAGTLAFLAEQDEEWVAAGAGVGVGVRAKVLAAASGRLSVGGSPSLRSPAGDSLPLVRLQAPLARTRSYSMLGSGAGPGMGPPALAAWPPATAARVGAAGSQRR